MSKVAMLFWHDEGGFIVSAELILIATVVVLGMVVGLAEVSLAVNHELEDVATAFGSLNQSFRFSGLNGHQGNTPGSGGQDHADFCDSGNNITPTGATGEAN